MQVIIDILKSRGKLGGWGLIVLGIGHMAAVYFGWITGSYEFGGAAFLAGLALIGIRGKQEAKTP